MSQNLVACSRAMTRRSRAVTPSAFNELSRTPMRTRVQYCIPIGAALRPGSLLGLRSVPRGCSEHVLSCRQHLVAMRPGPCRSLWRCATPRCSILGGNQARVPCSMLATDWRTIVTEQKSTVLGNCRMKPYQEMWLASTTALTIRRLAGRRDGCKQSILQSLSGAWGKGGYVGWLTLAMRGTDSPTWNFN